MRLLFLNLFSLLLFFEMTGEVLHRLFVFDGVILSLFPLSVLPPHSVHYFVNLLVLFSDALTSFL